MRQDPTLVVRNGTIVDGTGASPVVADIAIAGDRSEDVAAVSAFVDALGFDAVTAGPLREGIRLEPGGEAFGANVDARELRRILERFPDSERGRLIAAARAVDEEAAA